MVVPVPRLSPPPLSLPLYLFFSFKMQERMPLFFLLFPRLIKTALKTGARETRGEMDKILLLFVPFPCHSMKIEMLKREGGTPAERGAADLIFPQQQIQQRLV